MNDERSLQTKRGGDDGIAGRAVANVATCLGQLLVRVQSTEFLYSCKDCATYAAAFAKGRVGCVDDGIGLGLGDVALNNGDGHGVWSP